MLKDIFVQFVSTVLALLVAYVSFKYFRKRIKKFNSTLYENKDIEKFTQFIFERDTEIFWIDINVEQPQANEFISDFSISFPELSEEEEVIGGVRVVFLREDENKIFIDMRPVSNRIRGCFKITHASGPQMGWFTIILKYVEVESVYDNL